MTADQARDEMLAVFKAAWDTTGFVAVYSDVPGQVPASEAPWARVVVRHADGKQASLANDHGAKKYTQIGTLWAQVFTPIGDGMSQAYAHAQIVVNAFSQARSASVWYRNPRMREMGNSGAFEQINVLVDFTYDDTR